MEVFELSEMLHPGFFLRCHFQFFLDCLGDELAQGNAALSGGGLGTVRGYLESEELGDNGIFGSTELRTPSLGDFIGKESNLHADSDAV